MNVYTEKVLFLGEPAIKAVVGNLEAIVVPGLAGNCLSLKHVPKNVELLRIPKSLKEFYEVPVLFGIPILFPPNRIADGRFEYNNRVYQFDLNEPTEQNHSHGFVFDKSWEFIETKITEHDVSITLRFRSQGYTEVLRQFPHLFLLEMTYRLSEHYLTIESVIRNEGEQSFPWGLGFHTTFNYPFRNGDDLSKCEFSLSANEQWELDHRFLPTGIRKSNPYAEMPTRMKLNNIELDDVFTASKNKFGHNEAVIIDHNVGLTVRYRCDDSFKFWVIYNADSNQGYLCPEPYTWVTNAPNLPMDPMDTGFRIIKPGETYRLSSVIMVEE